MMLKKALLFLIDVPMILSGNYLAILEPTETIFGRTPGKRWHLEDNQEELTELLDLVIGNIGLICVTAIQIIRETFLTDFRPHRPPVTCGDILLDLVSNLVKVKVGE